MATAAQQYDRREQAFRDFCNLEAEGIDPNPNALYEVYKEQGRLARERQGLPPPTTNRTTIYTWCREDRWKERYAEIKEVEADIRDQKFQNVRDRSYAKLISFQNEALETLLDLTKNAKDGKVRLQAAESILDRTGLVKQPYRAAREDPQDNAPSNEDADELPENATEQQITEWLLRNTQSGLNA